ncbi:hypothetical protein HMPREF9004_0814 [Schaalia cardiffensis F0333]|uniref:Uncharacterized protein n=1 Tax=Schaalia cardiffensis F0333 TaxID=888050 RepID=N6W6W2_9ACTO|nr:hypothetical protein HMPREF9004_0814 [Schaalia cardiffensis F0333]
MNAKGAQSTSSGRPKWKWALNQPGNFSTPEAPRMTKPPQ